MTTALPSVHRGPFFASNQAGLSPYPGPQVSASNSWTPSGTDEGFAFASGDGGPGPGLGMPLHSAPAYFFASPPSTPGAGHGHTQMMPQSPPPQSPPPPPQQQQQQPQQPAPQSQLQLPMTPDGVHRFVRDRVQGVPRGPLAATSPCASPAPYAAYTSPAAAGAAPAGTGAAMGPPRSPTPEQIRRHTALSDRPGTASGWVGAAVAAAAGGGGGGGAGPAAAATFPQASYPLAGSGGSDRGAGGGGSGSPPSGRMITHDAFVSRPTTSNANERRRLFTGTSQELLRVAVATPPQHQQGQGQQQQQAQSSLPTTPSSGGGGSGFGANWGEAFANGSRMSLRGWAQPPWASTPGTPPASASATLTSPSGGGGGGGGEHRMRRGRARGMSGGNHNLGRSLPVSPHEAESAAAAAVAAAASPYASLPLSAPGRRSPSPRLIHLHPGGLGSAAMSMIAAGHHMSRQQVIMQYRGVERLLALDVEEALARAATPRQVATLTPGSLDGMGHPVLLAADGARILKRIPDHLPRHAAERLVATPMRPEQLSMLLGHGLDPDLDLDGTAHIPDDGDGLSSGDDADYPRGGGARAGGANISTLPYMSLGQESSIGGGGAGLPGGGGGRPGTRAGAGRKGLAGGPGGGGGADGVHGSPLKMMRSWSSPSRQPRGGGAGGAAVHPRNETLDGSAAAGGGGGGLAVEGSRASRIGADVRGSGSMARRRGSRSPPPPTASREGPTAGGRAGSPGRISPGRGGGLRTSVPGEETGSAAPPKWLGTYIPKEDPLGLWTGKRMSKTEVIVEKRLFAMRHNPGMRLELESRASEALRQRAAAQAEMAAVTRAREEEALARKAQLRAEIEARKRGWNPRDMERNRSRNHRGLTREAKAALERQLLAEADAAPRGPLSREEAAIIIQSMWRMYQQRRAFLHFRAMVIRIQRAARLRYCVVRNRRRHVAAAGLLLDFLSAIGGSRQAAAAMDLREIHSNYLRRRLLEKKGDLRHQTAVAVLVREWEAVEARVLGLRSRSLKGSALAAMAAVGFTASATGPGGHQNHPGGGGAAGHPPGPPRVHHRAGAGASSGGADKDMLKSVAGEARSAAHGTRLLGRALEARKKGVMLLAGGKDLNKQLTVEYAVAHCLATDRVTLTSRQPVPSEVKAVVAACYLEHKSIAYTAFIGVVWRRRARWFGMFNQQRHMAMARSVVQTGSAWQVMDEMAREATEALVGSLPVLPRMRTTATVRELRALMQTGVQEADLYTSYMLKGGIHELERRLHSEMLLRQSFGHMLRGREPREVSTPPSGPSTGPGDGPPAGGGGAQRRWPTASGSPGQRHVSGNGAVPTTNNGPVVQSPLGPQSSTTSVNPDSPRRPSRTVRIDPATPSPGGTSTPRGGGSGGGAAPPPPPSGPDAFLDTVSEAGSEMTSASNLSALAGFAAAAGGGAAAAGGTAGLARARFLSMLPSNKAGVAQLRERWWREAVVRVDACLRKRYKLNNVSLVASLEDKTAPNLELFSAKLAEINANPEKADALMAALPGGAVGTSYSSGVGGGIAALIGGSGVATGGGHGGVGGGGGGGGGHKPPPRSSAEGGAWQHRGT